MTASQAIYFLSSIAALDIAITALGATAALGSIDYTTSHCSPSAHAFTQLATLGSITKPVANTAFAASFCPIEPTRHSHRLQGIAIGFQGIAIGFQGRAKKE